MSFLRSFSVLVWIRVASSWKCLALHKWRCHGAPWWLVWSRRWGRAGREVWTLLCWSGACARAWGRCQTPAKGLSLLFFFFFLFLNYWLYSDQVGAEGRGRLFHNKLIECFCLSLRQLLMMRHQKSHSSVYYCRAVDSQKLWLTKKNLEFLKSNYQPCWILFTLDFYSDNEGKRVEGHKMIFF